jgi:uncharacterized damage-inducible protein DinB
VPGASDGKLIAVILDSWDRNNRILINLVGALPPGGLEARVMPGSPSVAEMLSHIHYVRLVLLSEDVPELAAQVPEAEWIPEGEWAGNPNVIAEQLQSSGKAVRDAIETCIERGQEMKIHYDHPLLCLQHLIWHEGYHHGQIKLALKVNGHPLDDKEIGALTWHIWFDKAPRG